MNENYVIYVNGNERIKFFLLENAIKYCMLEMGLGCKCDLVSTKTGEVVLSFSGNLDEMWVSPGLKFE